MRFAALLSVMAALAGCQDALNEAPETAEGAEVIQCALASAQDFSAGCTAELVETEEGRVVILRNPDGGFRRLRITGGEGLLEAADGADALQVKRSESALNVTIGPDRYILPISGGGNGK